MSAQWMVYAVAVGAVMTLAALAAEQGTRLVRRAGRWTWAAALVLTVALPLLAPTLAGQSPPPASGAPALAPTLVLSGLPATPVIRPSSWLPAGGAPGSMDRIDHIDRVAQLAWILSSVLALAALAGAHVALHRRRRTWRPGSVAGAPVLVSADAGPAVVGVLRPQVVVPAWLLAAHPARQAIVMAHEAAHIAAGDQRLLAAMTLLLVAMPWNLPLWYQVHRLRLAIEVDCDARVLAQGCRLADYGAALIDAGSQGARTGAARFSLMTPAVAAGFLERRLRLMTRRPARWHRIVSTILLLLAIDIGVVAARIDPPRDAVTPQVAVVPLASRQALAGYYQLDDHRVATVAVSADGLEVKTNIEPVWRLRPESTDRYFLPATGMRVRFDRAAGTLTVSYFDTDAAPAARVDAVAVERADAYVASRRASGQALPGGAAIVARNVGAREAGQLHAADFTPGFLQQAVAQMPRQRRFNERAGKVEAITFVGVDGWGWDRYQVRYATRTVTWAIWLDDAGRLASARPEGPLR
jgi:bla regulator protein BlaR1